MPGGRTVSIGLALLALIAVAPAVPAHNPADTVYEPAPLGDGLLVVGEEGTAALIGLDGEPRWRTHRSIHVTSAPVVSDGTALVAGRAVPGGTLLVQAFDADGPAWQAEIGPQGAFGFPAASPDGFAVTTTDGRLVHITQDGEVASETDLGFGALVAPVPAPGPTPRWIVAGQEGKIAEVGPDGPEHETRLGGRPTDLARVGDRVLAAFRGGARDAPAVKAYDANLTTQWVHDVDGLRVGGELAPLGDGVVFGTFRPGGARVVALAGDGETAWTRTFHNETAAAVSSGDGALYVTVNSGVLRLSDQGEPGWRTETSPRLVGPTVTGDLVLPSGASNELVALDPDDGSVAWRYTDGVSQVPWSDEELGGGAGADDAGQDGGVEIPSPGILAGVLSLSLACRLRRPNRR